MSVRAPLRLVLSFLCVACLFLLRVPRGRSSPPPAAQLGSGSSAASLPPSLLDRVARIGYATTARWRDTTDAAPFSSPCVRHSCRELQLLRCLQRARPAARDCGGATARGARRGGGWGGGGSGLCVRFFFIWQSAQSESTENSRQAHLLTRPLMAGRWGMWATWTER